MKPDKKLTVAMLSRPVDDFLTIAGPKILRLLQTWPESAGAPVFTRKGLYTSRGWTEWTEGFLYGLPLLYFDATGEYRFFEIAKEKILRRMAPHLTHIGVHDHGFNNVSTYGNLRRLALEGRSGDSAEMIRLYEMALRVSGAVQAARWTDAPAAGGGYIYSFNGPHSLFSDTIRSCRALMLAHQLGHVLCGENDRRISLLQRAMDHIRMTLRWNVYYGAGRDAYDVRGRVAHEGIFNLNDGCYRCPSTQQGYSPFSTWTRGLAWILLGCAEELEFLQQSGEPIPEEFTDTVLEGARATADFYIAHSCADGIPFWDTGAPGLAHLEDYRNHPSAPDNPWEPVDSSAAAIAAQGLLRLGRYLGLADAGKPYFLAGLTLSRTLFSDPYLSKAPKHQGLLLHSVYHRPNGWDYIPRHADVPLGESSMWGDYHAMELAVYLHRLYTSGNYLTFFAS